MSKLLLILSALGVLAVLAMRWGGRGRLPEVGSMAPDFDLPDSADQRHVLLDYRGRWLVLYFYPKDSTPVCTLQACNFRDGFSEFQARQVALLGISLDAPDSHAHFAQRHGLPFPLLCDTHAKVARAYGSVSDFGLFRFAKRHTFLIDPNGRVAKIYRKMDVARHAQEILHDLNQFEARLGVVAPSSGANNSATPRNP